MPVTIRASCLIGGLTRGAARLRQAGRSEARATGPSGRPGDPRRSAVRAHLEARDVVLAYRAGVAFGEARRPRTPRIDEDGAGREAVRLSLIHISEPTRQAEISYA